jgi:hypothetical protein
MIRIEYCKHKNIPISKEALYSDLKHYIKDRGQLLKEVISIDDGIHAEKVES